MEGGDLVLGGREGGFGEGVLRGGEFYAFRSIVWMIDDGCIEVRGGFLGGKGGSLASMYDGEERGWVDMTD